MRVSTKDQNEQRQIVAMLQAGIRKDNIFIDKMSGKNFERDAYKKMLEVLEPGDTLYIKSINRLGRNYTEIIEQWGMLNKTMKVDIVVLDMPLLDTRYGKDLLGTFLSDLVLQVLSFVAENERDTIRSNQAEGIAVAKAAGVRFGRPRRMEAQEFKSKYIEMKRAGLKNKKIQETMELPRSTFYRYLQAVKNEWN